MRTSLGLNFSTLYPKWSQFFWKEIRIYLLCGLLLSASKISEVVLDLRVGIMNFLPWVIPPLFNWTPGGGRSSSPSLLSFPLLHGPTHLGQGLLGLHYSQRQHTQHKGFVPPTEGEWRKRAPTSLTFAWNLAQPTGSCRQNEKCQHSAPPGKIAL